MKYKKTLSSALCSVLILSTMSTLSFLPSSAKLSSFDVHSPKIEPPLTYNSNESNTSISGYSSICGYIPPTSPYPLYDELTEHAHRETSGLKEYLTIGYFGYWCESSNPGNHIDVIHEPTIVGNCSIIDISYVDHHYLLFYSNYPMDLSTCDYVKYYQLLSPVGHTGNSFFEFFEFNEDYTEVYIAALEYNISADGLFYRQDLNLRQLGNWIIDSQFDFGKVAGFVISAEATSATTMLIDGPKLYFDYDDPLPVNERIDEADGLGQETYTTGNENRTRAIVQLWHGTYSATYENWLLKIYIEDLYYYSSEATDHPSFCKVSVHLPYQATEYPPCHYPVNGYVGSSRLSTGLSYGGIGFSITSAEKYISYHSGYKNGTFNIEWNVEPSKFWGSVSGCIFFDYSEFAIGFRTPLGFKPWAYVSAELKMYAPAMPFDEWPDWTHRSTQLIDWIYVDPPGSDPPQPGTTESMITPETAYFVSVNEMQTLDNYRGTIQTEFQRGDEFWLWCNFSWGLPNATQMCVDMRVYDSNATMISLLSMLSWNYLGYYMPQWHYLFGTTLFAPTFATIGQAKIVVRILNDWPWIDDREYSRMEMNINITA